MGRWGFGFSLYELSKTEEREVKKIARQLLDTLKREKLVLGWKKKQQTRADVKVALCTG